jgi:hypothetical protein
MIPKAQQRWEASTPRHHCRHCLRFISLYQIWAFFLYAERSTSWICFYFTDKYLYASYNNVELIEQALR